MSQKSKGQVFTPVKIVKIILDSVGYTGKDILNKKIIEPSFGQGVFLVEILSRLIEESRKLNKTNNEIKDVIENCVYGIEQDIKLYKETLDNLNKLLSENNIPACSWKNLINGDALLEYSNFINQMDFCVGNPPYVRIHNIEEEYRNLLNNFSFSKGNTDLYIIFYEIGLQLLKEDSGKLGYISPNSFLRNTSQKEFRNYLISRKILSSLYDFKDSNIFNVGTYTCICIIDKQQTKNIEYREYNMYNIVSQLYLDWSYFISLPKGATWNLGSQEEINFLEKNRDKTTKLKDIANVQNCVSTNANSIYTGKAWLDKECKTPYWGKHTDSKVIVWFNGYQVESTILHRCVKASNYDGVKSNDYIIFPYSPQRLENNVEKDYTVYSEEQLKKDFPLAYIYLLAHKEELVKRNMEKNTNWYEYARSQGLLTSGQKKIAVKHILSKDNPKVMLFPLDEDVIVYTGLYITEKTYPLKEIYDLLNTPEFSKYCYLLGKNINGGYVYFSSVALKKYGIN